MSFRSLLFILVSLVLADGQALAQAAPAPAPQQAVGQAGGPEAADLRSIDNALRLLKDERSRAAIIEDLESLRRSLQTTGRGDDAGLAASEPATEPAPATEAEPAVEPVPPAQTAAPPAAAPVAPPQEAILTENGLMGALTAWVGDVTGDLRDAAMGTPIDRKIELAGQQLLARLSDSDNRDRVGTFALWAMAGWALAFSVLYGLTHLPWIRRRAVAHHRSEGGRLWREVALRTLFGLLPLVAAALILIAWPTIAGMGPRGGAIFAMLASPVWFAILARRLFHHLLELAAPSRGWRLVGYSQRRVGPWVAGLVGLALVSVILRDPALRSAIGIAAADIALLLVDLLVNLAAVLFVLKHKDTVRSLLVRGRIRRKKQRTAGPVETALVGLAGRWHLIAVLFLALNIVARLFGTNSQGFVSQISLSILYLTLGTMVAVWIRSRSEILVERLGRRRSNARSVILCRVTSLLALVIQLVVVVLVIAACFKLWGLDFAGWLEREPGRTITASLVAIGSVLLVSWALWIVIDSWIEHALTPVDHLGRARPMSNRVKTLLPLLRNFVFVTLTVLTIIAVLANLGINVAPLLAGAGVVGLAIGFGSQQLVQDVITGLFILLEDTISIGDVIDTGDRSGTVEALTIRTVRIRDIEGSLHSIPFSQITALKNRSRDFGVYVVEVMVAQHTNLQQALDTMTEVGAAMMKEPFYAAKIILPLEPWGVDSFTPDGIVLKGAVRTRALEQWTVGRELNRRLQVRFDELGIELARRMLPAEMGKAA